MKLRPPSTGIVEKLWVKKQLEQLPKGVDLNADPVARDMMITHLAIQMNKRSKLLDRLELMTKEQK